MNMRKLMKDIEKARNEWNEYSPFRIRGVGGLSPSDLDTIELYAQTGGQGLMRPLGPVKDVLEKYGYEHHQSFGF